MSQGTTTEQRLSSMQQAAPDFIHLAWMGWQVRVPPHWRPLHLGGDWNRGDAMLGSAYEAMLQVRWWRPEKRNFKFDRWLHQRAKTVARRAAMERLDYVPEGFTTLVSVTGDVLKKGPTKLHWYGFAPTANLLLELMTNSSVSQDAREKITSLVLPSLRVSSLDAPTRWAIFDVSFETPPGFSLEARRINVGDIALEFTAQKGRKRLFLRQVYPAKLALTRRELAKWLKFSPFKDYRRYKQSEEIPNWTLDSSGRKLTGYQSRGRKCLAFPLSWFRWRGAIAAAVVDPDLDRLLLAEYDAEAEANEEVIKTVLSRMNWAQRQSQEAG